ncbi:hypothetical protein AAC387_Pa02g3555 [Persea americana]
MMLKAIAEDHKPVKFQQAVFVQLQATGFVKDIEDDRGRRGQIRLKPWLDPSALASALSNWNPGEVSALESARLVWTSRLVCKLLRAFKGAETAWEFFCWAAYLPGGFTHDVYTVSRMIAILARSAHVDLVDSLLSKIKREGIRLSFSTVRLVVDLYGLSKKADAALRVFRELELICGAVSKSGRRLLYSSLLRTFIKCKRSSVAMDLVEEMVLSGLIPDILTQSELEPNAYMYQMLIRAYCKRKRAALALRVFEDMRGADLWPNAATKALLVKSLWKEGKLREAAAVEEKGEEVRDLLPVALPGHVWNVSSADLWHVYNIYSSSFAMNDQSYGNLNVGASTKWGEIVADDWLPFSEFVIHWRKEMNSGNSIWRTINWNKHATIEAPSSNFMLLEALHHLNLRSPLNPSKSGTPSDRMSKLLHLAHANWFVYEAETILEVMVKLNERYRIGGSVYWPPLVESVAAQGKPHRGVEDFTQG